MPIERIERENKVIKIYYSKFIKETKRKERAKVLIMNDSFLLKI